MLIIPEKITPPLTSNSLGNINKVSDHSSVSAATVHDLNKKPSSAPSPAPSPTASGSPSAANTPPPVNNKPMPRLEKPVRMGMKTPIPAQCSRIKAGVGWKIKDSRCDVDASAFLVGASDKVRSDDWFVFYGQPQSPDNSVSYNDDPVDQKAFDIDLNRLDQSVDKIVFVVTIDQALVNNLNFSMLDQVYIRLLDGSSEILSFQLTEYFSSVTSMMMGELYRYKGQWKFNAIGNGVARDLAGLCSIYGVNIE